MSRVYLGSLTHNGHLHYRMAKTFFVTACRDREVMFEVQQTSLLAFGCNRLWCNALNNRDKMQLKWFAMLHADIAPEDFWLDKLIAIAEKYDADMVSAVVPLKSPDGLTSTALSSRDRMKRYARLTQRQINDPAMPLTFDIADLKKLSYANVVFESLKHAFAEEWPYLLLNTGCFVVRLDKPWANKAFFTINDRIDLLPGNQFVARNESEDWFFSRTVDELGGKVMATREITVEHIGSAAYRSDSIWGLDNDPSMLKFPDV